ncbi:bypass of stop codon protein 1-like isoform X2 [Haliotis rufescens]|uniref:bypass of stop codon protein 1-like isoform X2 n=1 Tax=Haliotis rufescens TaxID=6454 RepID=UPI00201E8042|nr:bypass of stop codon protein 1-like isoform X2 [Haliotis rufescens]
MSRLVWSYISAATVLVTSIDAACPTSLKVIDMCDPRASSGNDFYIDSAMMAEGHHQCSCTLSTYISHSMQMVEVTRPTTCRAYWYNASLSLGQDLDTLAYEYNNGSCEFPHVWGQLSYSSIPWTISITRRGDGLSQEGEGDPGFCLQVFSTDRNAFLVKCGHTAVATTSTVDVTSATSSTSTSTTATSTSTTASSASTTATSTSTTATSTSTTATSTSATATSTTATSTFATTPSTSTTETSTLRTTSAKSTPATSTSASTAATATSTAATSSTSTTPSDVLDSVTIGVSVTGLLLLILLVAVFIHMGHQRTKTYTKKDVENVVYVTEDY